MQNMTRPLEHHMLTLKLVGKVCIKQNTVMPQYAKTVHAMTCNAVACHAVVRVSIIK